MSEIQHENGSGVMERKVKRQPRRSLQFWLIGRPLQTADAPHQTIGKAIGLAVFASDALSSTGYATQEIMFVLATAGTSAFMYVFPISIAIVILMAIVSISYEQTIHAYHDGGGSYIVARDNLGELPAQTAGASLLTDYILTVAVSISSGVAQFVSAVPALSPYRVEIAVALVIFIMIVNLRGVKESGAIFAFPIYFFIAMTLLTLIIGLYKFATGTLGTVVNPPAIETTGPLVVVTGFLLLRAFSSGTSALTGIEAISNGITAFKEPRSRNAGITLIWMSVIMATLFLGISFLSGQIAAVPSEQETVISQLARTVAGGRNIFYLLTIMATTIILILAANTSFADFPRLSALMAKDGFLPRQLAFRGSRLVFSRGIAALAILASILIIVFKASVNLLIPLYAIGVFLSFTLSQTGMAHRWWKSGHLKPGKEVKERGSILAHDPKWVGKMIVNGVGAILTAVVTVVFAVTKFRDGAWVVMILIPGMVLFLSAIHRHYRRVATNLSLENYGEPPHKLRHRVIMPVSGIHRGSLAALGYARMLSDDVTVVHVSVDPDETERVRKKWEVWGEGIRLVILDSPYRLLVEPLLDYIEEVADLRQPNEVITVVVPYFVPKKSVSNLLHMQTANALRRALSNRKDIVITDVPYQVED
jgi:amino acid transporter